MVQFGTVNRAVPAANLIDNPADRRIIHHGGLSTITGIT